MSDNTPTPVVLVTDHAEIRMKERLGLRKKAIQRMAQRAFESGFRRRDTKGRLKRYLDASYSLHGKGNQVRVYGDFIYIFHSWTLITVLNLPSDLRGGLPS